MAGTGRISVLVSRPLSVLSQAIAQAEPEVRKQIRVHTKPVAETAWQEELQGRVETRLEVRVLHGTARVATSDSNILLKSATVGKVRGVPASVLAPGTEFGASPDRQVKSRSRAGTAYTRRLGAVFRPPRRGGYVVHPAASAVIPRVGALWVQTTLRTFAEQVEKVGT